MKDRKNTLNPCIRAVVCDSCDMLLEGIDVKPGYTAVCPRCGTKLYAPKKDSCTRTLAFTITALLLFYPAMVMPIMTLYVFGMEENASIVDSIFRLFEKGYIFVSATVLFTVFIFPLLRLLLLFCVSVSLKCRKRVFKTHLLMRCCHYLGEWCMAEIYMLGVFVTVIKVYHMAYIKYDAGFFCFAGLIISTVFASTSMDERFYWDSIEKLQTGNR